MDKGSGENTQQLGENPPNFDLYKPHVPRPAKRKWRPLEAAYEVALKKELEKVQKAYSKLEVEFQRVKEKLKASRRANEIKYDRIQQIKHSVKKKGRPQVRPDPLLVKLSEAERVMILNIVAQYNAAPNKELFLTKLKFAIGIDPMQGYNGRTDSGALD